MLPDNIMNMIYYEFQNIIIIILVLIADSSRFLLQFYYPTRTCLCLLLDQSTTGHGLSDENPASRL